MSKLQKCLYLIDLLDRRGAMSLKEINEHYRYSSLYDSDIQPRTFLRYKDYILLNFPCYIEYNAATQKYYLIKNDYNKGNQSLYEYLLSAFHIEGMSELAIKHRDRIMLTASPTGIVNVQPILEAIDAGKGIEFDYWSFNKQTKKHLVAIPYFLRTWERRWYLVAEPDNHHHGQSVFALERMENISLTPGEMQPSSNISVQDYFKGSFGVNHSDEQVPVTIHIRVYGTQADYVRALPIHESQREIERTDEWTDFEMDLVPCYNFYQQLLWHREKLEVLSPSSVRDELHGIICQILRNYEKNAH